MGPRDPLWLTRGVWARRLRTPGCRTRASARGEPRGRRGGIRRPGRARPGRGRSVAAITVFDGGHVIAGRRAASRAARMASGGREGTERRTCFVSRPVSRPVAGGLEIPTATAIARPGGVSRGRAPRALASAMPPLTPRPPLSSPLLPAPAPPPRGSLWPHLFCVLYQRSPKNKMSRKIRPLLLCKTVYGQTIVINERTAPGRHGSQRILF